MFKGLAGRAPLWLRFVTFGGLYVSAMYVATKPLYEQTKKRMAANMSAFEGSITGELGKVQDGVTAIQGHFTAMRKDNRRVLDRPQGEIGLRPVM